MNSDGSIIVAYTIFRCVELSVEILMATDGVKEADLWQ